MPSEHRLHPSSVIFQIGGQLKNLLLPGIVALFAARASDSKWEVWAMLLIVPSAIAATVRALSVRYRFDPAELVIRSGFIFRRERRIPYDRIHNIDAIQNIAHRVLNVMEVRLETAGGSDTEAELRVLSVEAFREMRQQVQSTVVSRQSSVDSRQSAAAPPPPIVDRLLELPVREVALLGLLQGRGLVVVGAGFGVLWELGLIDRMGDRFFGANATGRGVLRQFALALVGQGAAPTQQIGLMLAVFVAFVLALRVLSVALALMRFYGFLLTRAREELRSEFGLFTRVSATIPTRRIQTLTVYQGPLYRLFRRAAVRVDTAGGHTEEQVQTQRQWLAPIVGERALPALVRAVLPVADTSAVAWQPVHPRAFRRAIRPSLAAAAVTSVVLVAVLHWWTLALFALLSIWAVAATRRYVASLGWGLTDSAVVFRSGWMSNYVTVAPLAKVQAVSVHESPFDRHHGMGTLLVDTAGGGDAPHRVEIPYLPRDVAHALRDRIVVSTAGTAFKW